jgi:trimethylamine--corrinoid protein Co-methyltransferase
MNKDVRVWNTSKFNTFTPEQMLQVHGATMTILEDVGQIIHHDEAIDLLKKAGAYVEGDRVYIPASLVEWAARRTPSRINLYNRRGEEAMKLEGYNAYYGTGSDCPSILDSYTGEKRKFLYQDVQNAMRLTDALPNLDFVMSVGLIHDVPRNLSYQHEYAIMVRDTIKPSVITAADRESLDDITEMAAAVRGSREALKRKPYIVLYDEPSSPLSHSFTAIDKLLYCAENLIPTNYAPGIMAGATAPLTMAGAIAQANAEILTGLVITQLKNPGAPFVHGGGMSPMDMVSMQPTYAAPEAVMTQAGLCDMGRFYNLPTWGFAGCSASKLPDEQATNEATYYMLMAAMCGTNIIHDVGYLEFGLTYSFDYLVMCDEIIGQIKRLMEGVKVDPEYLAVDAVRRVGPGGHYLGDEHTFRHFRENWMPTGVVDRNTYDVWKANGATTMGQRANAKVKSILENYQPEALDKAIDAKIEAVINKAAGR